MADLVFVALLVALFGALVAFVHGCDRIVGIPSGGGAAVGPARHGGGVDGEVDGSVDGAVDGEVDGSVDGDGPDGDGGARADGGVDAAPSREGAAP